ncbi:hypothetical protein N9D42_02790 [Candidatus Thioglobus sp.]|nr:hypothetical protein [Candidatus Thioglobus sp.]
MKIRSCLDKEFEMQDLRWNKSYKSFWSWFTKGDSNNQTPLDTAIL